MVKLAGDMKRMLESSTKKYNEFLIEQNLIFDSLRIMAIDFSIYQLIQRIVLQKNQKNTQYTSDVLSVLFIEHPQCLQAAPCFSTLPNYFSDSNSCTSTKVIIAYYASQPSFLEAGDGTASCLDQTQQIFVELYLFQLIECQNFIGFKRIHPASIFPHYQRVTKLKQLFQLWLTAEDSDRRLTNKVSLILTRIPSIFQQLLFLMFRKIIIALMVSLVISQSITLLNCDDSHQKKHPLCCPAGSWPALQVNYTPEGKIRDYLGLQIYEVGRGGKPLLMLEDIFGIESGRHRIVADTYAKLGYHVFLAQFLDPYYSGPQDVPKILAVVAKQKLPALKEKYEKISEFISYRGFNKFLAIGFCWGAWLAFKMSAEYDNIIAIVAAHPSFQTEGYYGGTDQTLVTNLKAPAWLFVGGNDNPNLKPNGTLTSVLVNKFGSQSGSVQFPDMSHGWVIRGDVSNQIVKRDVEATIKQSNAYFKQFDC